MLASRVIYLHGFASSPESRKAVAVAERLRTRGIDVDRLDLRVPSMERLDFGAMLERTRAAIGGPDERAVLIGSSLGGLTAARVAEHDRRVVGMVLMAPALHFGARWHERLGQAGWDQWMETGWLDVHDYATGGTTRVHADFARSVLQHDVGLPYIHPPTLVIHGEADDVVPVTVSRELANVSPQVRLIVLPDGHDLLATLPMILDSIEAFVLSQE
ncbi:MAG TPA: YqiA/YcfP family alpha/beta fold hydrolase [Kofleriaceae bacterium]|nr:YqiA/YcfP family alpha/beta fold hydrolase [Kofleriaceae bacterium]